MIPAKLLLKYRQNLIRELARVGRRTDNEELIARKMTLFLPLPRQGKELTTAGQASASAAPSAMAFAYFAVPPVGLKYKL